MNDRYTQVPRTTLWLLPEDEARIGGDGPGEGPAFEADVRPIYIGKSVITNEQYEAFDPAHARCEASPGDDHPVVDVSFREALAYCEWYADLSRKAFRLPSEVEWERACRGGSTGRWSWGDDPGAGRDFAWTAETSKGEAHPVESLRANPAGLHDTLGLVWEWTSSLHRPYPATRDDGRDALEPRGERVVRGGSYRTPVTEAGCATRRALPEDHRADDLGFRIARYL